MREVELLYSSLEEFLLEGALEVGSVYFADNRYRGCDVVGVNHSFECAGSDVVSNVLGSLGGKDFDIEVEVFLSDEVVAYACHGRVDSLAVDRHVDAVARRLGRDLECEVASAHSACHKARYIGFGLEIVGECEVVDRCLVVDSRQCGHDVLVDAFDNRPCLLVVRSCHAYEVALPYSSFVYAAVDIHLISFADTARPCAYGGDELFDTTVGSGKDGGPEGSLLHFERVDADSERHTGEYVYSVGEHANGSTVVGNSPCRRAHICACRFDDVEVDDCVGVYVDTVVSCGIGFEKGRVGVYFHSVIVLEGILGSESHFLAGSVTAGLGVACEFHGGILHHVESEVGRIGIIVAGQLYIHIPVGIIVVPVLVRDVSVTRCLVGAVDRAVCRAADKHAPVDKYRIGVLYPHFAQLRATVEHVVFICIYSSRDYDAFDSGVAEGSVVEACNRVGQQYLLELTETSESLARNRVGLIGLICHDADACHVEACQLYCCAHESEVASIDGAEEGKVFHIGCVGP